MSDNLYAQPRPVSAPDECVFYHTMELPGFGVVEGQWDLRGRVNDYVGGVPLSGKRVLDVGTASGFLTFEMEKAGAEVVSMDADSADRIAMLPFHDRLYSTDHEEWKRQTNTFLDRLKNSYWLAHCLYQSRAKVFYGDVYDLPDSLGMFDTIVVGQILVHLRDPISALASIARRCADTLVVVEGMLDTDDTIARFYARANKGPEWIWWQYSIGLYRELMGILGFTITRVIDNQYLCQHEYTKGSTSVKTLVARRSGAST